MDYTYTLKTELGYRIETLVLQDFIRTNGRLWDVLTALFSAQILGHFIGNWLFTCGKCSNVFLTTNRISSE